MRGGETLGHRRCRRRRRCAGCRPAKSTCRFRGPTPGRPSWACLMRAPPGGMERSRKGGTAEARRRRGIEEARRGEDWRGELGMEAELRGVAEVEGLAARRPQRAPASLEREREIEEEREEGGTVIFFTERMATISREIFWRRGQLLSTRQFGTTWLNVGFWGDVARGSTQGSTCVWYS